MRTEEVNRQGQLSEAEQRNNHRKVEADQTKEWEDCSEWGQEKVLSI